MKNTEKITGMWFLSLFMVLAIVALAILVYQEYSAQLYETWSHELAVSLQNFSKTYAGN